MKAFRIHAVRFGYPPSMMMVGDGGEREVRTLRFGPNPEPQAAQEMRALQQGNELARIIRETFERMRKPLWFWEIEQ